VRLPDFIIIGAMKCATSTLHNQLALNGCHMSDPKEPCFFSDEPRWNRGIEWYSSLFEQARPGQLCGESSTHYTKLPTHPETASRMRRVVPDAKLIYVIRDPIERIVSQYIHEWSQCEITTPFADAIDRHTRLLDYSRYAMQIRPYVEIFGPDRVLIVFYECLKDDPLSQLDRVGRFIGLEHTPVWQSEASSNRSSERLRMPQPLREILFHPIVSGLRRRLVPARWREAVKSRLRMTDRPELDPALRDRIERVLDDDLAELARLTGIHGLCCARFVHLANRNPDPRIRSVSLSEGGGR